VVVLVVLFQPELRRALTSIGHAPALRALLGSGGVETLRVVDEIASVAGSLAERRIGELSGGQRQRVLLARALAQEAPVLLLDEPVSGVDTLSQQAVLAILTRLAREGSTILVATHDLALVAEYFDHVICFNRRLIAAGPTDSVLTEEILNATFNSRMVLVRVEGKLYAVDTGTHG